MLELCGATGTTVIGLVEATGATVLGLSGLPAATLGGRPAAVQADSSSSNDTAAAQIARRRKACTENSSSSRATTRSQKASQLRHFYHVSLRAPASPQGVSKVATSGRDRFAAALGQDRLSGSATKGSVAGSILQFRQKPLSPALRLGLQPAEQRHQRVVEKDLHPAGVGIDRVSSERLGGDHADTSEGELEAPLMGAQ